MATTTKTKKATPKAEAPAKKTPAKKASTKKAPTKKTPAKEQAAKKASPSSKKLSAVNAAAKVLAESKEPLTAKQMIEAMAAKRLWTSPGGKTPHATLYSAILREISSKGDDARFRKTERGKFALNA